ncbi:hypothetical protein NMG60_11009553 [Bertholletia excelsa]
MALGKSQAASTRDLKNRVLTCLNKLSDRDTHSAAAAELESIARTLSHDSIPPFISSISATDASDKSPVRKQCVRLISLLSESHGDALSPYLSKLLSAVVRRLRDPDSVVRSACINATSSISSHVLKPPFTSIVKPLVDALVTEQDQNSQIGAALCLAAAIDASPEPELLYLRKLLPRLERLLKCDGFKAKPALLTLIGSVIGAGASSSHQTQKNLVPCLVEFISSEEWAARKAASEALIKLAEVERDMLADFKAVCLKTFEAKKFDRVKIVRETMNQLVEAWKEIPDVSDEVSPPPEPHSTSKEDASGGQYPPGSKTSCTFTAGAPQIWRKSISTNSSCLPDGSLATTARKRSSLDSGDKKPCPAMFRKLDRKKPTGRKIEVATPHASSTAAACEIDSGSRNENNENGSRYGKPETKQALFNKIADDKMLKFGNVKAGSRVVPCQDESCESNVAVSNIIEDADGNQKECEDLSLIRKQLVHIENQQTSLLDLLQKFIGSSQNGMYSLETRVHGLELAIDEISHDLAMSTGRMSSVDSKGTTCCKLPGAELLSPKFWRRTEPRNSISGVSSSGGSLSMAARHHMVSNNANAETFRLETRRLRLQGSGQFIVNPLAEIPGESHEMSEICSNRVPKNVQGSI